MKFKEYIEGYNDLKKYMSEKYGVVNGLSRINRFEQRAPFRLDHKFNIVQSIDDMVFGQFIMMERSLTLNKEYNNALYGLATTILRPISDNVFDNTDYEKEIENTEKILNSKAKDVINECVIMSQKRNVYIKETYAGVFYKSSDETQGDEDEDEPDEIDTLEEKFGRDFYWHALVHALANERFLDHEAILMMKMADVAPHLAFLRMKGLIEYKQRKMREMASKIKH